jgi:hypothetical protein
VNIDDLDRLSVLLEDAYKALNQAWEITARAGELDVTNRLLLATIAVKESAEALAPADFPESLRV